MITFERFFISLVSMQFDTHTKRILVTWLIVRFCKTLIIVFYIIIEFFHVFDAKASIIIIFQRINVLLFLIFIKVYWAFDPFIKTFIDFMSFFIENFIWMLSFKVFFASLNQDPISKIGYWKLIIDFEIWNLTNFLKF